MSTNQLTIKLYESWMRDQVVSLTEREYPFMQNWYTTRFSALHESNYQKNRNCMVVAVDSNNKVVACISYVYWPLSFKNEILNSFQMVGLIVDSALRGKGLFKQVLHELDLQLAGINPDVVMGFPVETSKNGFLKKGWIHSFSLMWHISPVNLLALISKKINTAALFNQGTPQIVTADPFIQTSTDQAFWNLKAQISPEEINYYKTYTVGDKSIQLIFRIAGKAGFNFANLGKIYSGDAASHQIITAIKQWKTDLRKAGGILFAATSINTNCNSEVNIAVKKSFFKTSKKITVILKSYNQNTEAMNPDNWSIMMADMETW